MNTQNNKIVYELKKDDANEIMIRLEALGSVACDKAKKTKSKERSHFYWELYDNAKICIKCMQIPEYIKSSDDLKIVYEFDEFYEHSLTYSLKCIIEAFLKKIANIHDVNESLINNIKLYNRYNECMEIIKAAKKSD